MTAPARATGPRQRSTATGSRPCSSARVERFRDEHPRSLEFHERRSSLAARRADELDGAVGRRFPLFLEEAIGRAGRRRRRARVRRPLPRRHRRDGGPRARADRRGGERAGRARPDHDAADRGRDRGRRRARTALRPPVLAVRALRRRTRTASRSGSRARSPAAKSSSSTGATTARSTRRSHARGRRHEGARRERRAARSTRR